MNERVARYRRQRDELNAKLRMRVPVVPTQTEARGIPAVNAMRVLASVPNWSEVSLRDAHKPAETLRNLRPRADKCVSIMPDGTREDFSPAIVRGERRYTQRTTAQHTNHNAANMTAAERLALLSAAGIIGNVE